MKKQQRKSVLKISFLRIQIPGTLVRPAAQKEWVGDPHLYQEGQKETNIIKDGKNLFRLARKKVTNINRNVKNILRSEKQINWLEGWNTCTWVLFEKDDDYCVLVNTKGAFNDNFFNLRAIVTVMNIYCLLSISKTPVHKQKVL